MCAQSLAKEIVNHHMRVVKKMNQLWDRFFACLCHDKFCLFISFISALSDALDEETPQEIVHIEEDYSLYSDQPFGPVAARKVTEVVQSAVGILNSAMEYPKELITDAARPGYWVPDSDIVTCNCCNAAFKESDTKHHCRACGMGVCSNCSESRRPVPSRGWDHPVRVCDQCAAKKGQL